MLLREFLYVDGIKVRAMLGQADEGVAEELRKTRPDLIRVAGTPVGVSLRCVGRLRRASVSQKIRNPFPRPYKAVSIAKFGSARR
jgi:hypothetical protein